MKLAENLKLYRQREGISQETLAEYCQVSRQAITKWENGESLPTIKNLIFLADFYKISLDELVGLKNDMIILKRMLRRFIASDVKFGEDDEITALLGRYLTFASRHNISAEDTLNGIFELFLVHDEDL